MTKKLPKIITQEEFEKIFTYTIRSKKKNKKAYALAMLLGFEAGMRISEIVGLSFPPIKGSTVGVNKVPALTKDKVSLEQNTIRIESGKGNKDRIVPLPKRFNNAALNLLPIPLSRRSLQQYVTDVGLEVLEKHITFHVLRHGFGSHLAASGRPIHEIQMLMGHSRLETTGIYLHANPKTAIDGARDVF